MKLLPKGKVNLNSRPHSGLENGQNSQPGPVRVLYQRGQELLEFALVFPLLLLFIIAALDLGRMFYTTIVVANAAREGARYAITYGIDRQSTTSGDILVLLNANVMAAVIQEGVNSGITITGGDVQSTCLTCLLVSDPDTCTAALTCTSGQPVRVTVTHPFTPLVTSLIGSPALNIQRAVEMMVP